MTLELINPPDLPMPNTYTQVVVATGSRLVFVAGQEPEDAKGRLVGPGDLAVQARQAFANLSRALTAAGAEPDEVARITIYVVDYESVRHDGLMRLPWQPSEYTRTCTECGYSWQVPRWAARRHVAVPSRLLRPTESDSDQVAAIELRNQQADAFRVCSHCGAETFTQ